jgi:glycosyltransferase involved in cell wall biosynthesis
MFYGYDNKGSSTLMKVVIIHSQYRYKGGEDAVVCSEQNLVPNAKLWVRSNKNGIEALFQFLISVYNPFVAYSLKSYLKKEKPDVIHIHNLNFAIGPVVIKIAKKLGIPVVMTLHNYRLLCPSATLLHKGQIFTDSLDKKFPWKAVKGKVYRNSVLQTFWLAFSVWVHKTIGTWHKVDRFIVLSRFAKEIFGNSHLNIQEHKLSIKPNFVSVPTYSHLARTDSFLFVGRLSEEKGLEYLLSATIQSGFSLRIAGDGPLRGKVEDAAAQYSNITFLGPLESENVHKEVRECTALVFPSIWFEGMPMTIIEALANGTPVLASNLGAMADMIQHEINGLLFEPGDIESLVDCLKKWNEVPFEERNFMSLGARSSYEQYYTPEKNYEQLLSIYHSVLKEVQN